MKEVQAKNHENNKAEKGSSASTDHPLDQALRSIDVTGKQNNYPVMMGLLDESHDTEYPFFTEKAFLDMTLGRIPDFESLYQSLSRISVPAGLPLSALQFMPALKEYTLSDLGEIENFLNNPETNHVLVQNDLIKIVLIRWEPGDKCRIHGHAEGGCVFKVLKGKVVERRFSADDDLRELAEGTYSEGNMAYIDDMLGLHSVGNPFTEPAITLHMYTPGNYKASKK